MIEPWLENLQSIAHSNIKQGRMPNALALRGDKGLGKQKLLLSLAQSLLCLSSKNGLPCGHCHSCELYIAGSHPEFRRLGQSDKAASIDDVRDLQQWLSSKPSISVAKVVYLGDLSTFSIAVANALLKSIEEPNTNSYFLAYDPRTQQLIATIQSRFQFWVVEGPNQQQCMQWLSDNKQGRSSQLPGFDLCYRLCRGAPYELLEFVRSGQQKQLQSLIEFWQANATNDIIKMLNDKSMPWAIDALILHEQSSLKSTLGNNNKAAQDKSQILMRRYQRLIEFKREFRISLGLNTEIQVLNLLQDMQELTC
ncbi:hypothetical protein DBZ36_06675 [Alginatibacterium sediminis]|uniref:DNA-directed DNA polymerase n=1 Tax=Alginatibacterium sediminis TaxID=2164068 RepID=A0A420EHT7_9ALTE|nr:hypothetical protein [Alginatibacterium sediminis]RKF20126.1 hypothetical protein DBZ36_06675 [Alginatibacterium sediminis]